MKESEIVEQFRRGESMTRIAQRCARPIEEIEEAIRCALRNAARDFGARGGRAKKTMSKAALAARRKGARATRAMWKARRIAQRCAKKG